jgi:enoyl-CoA hydratase/carnithine racemase
LENPNGDKRNLARSGRVSTPFMFNDVGLFINPKQNDLWKPVVAAVNGMACGGALYMLGEADILIAAENATFFDPHVTFGMVSGFESVHLLQKLPLGETLRLALLGSFERMSAARAREVGLVSEVVPQADLMERAMWVASSIASQPVLAVQGTLRAIWMAHENLRQQALEQVSHLVNLGTPDTGIHEGHDTFQAARPKWQLR